MSQTNKIKDLSEIVTRNIKERPKTVDEYLNEVNYNPDHYKNYIPSEFALKLIAFIKQVNEGGSQEENVTPLLHYFILDGFANDDPYVLNMIFRGAAKMHPVDTMIPTPQGWKTVGELEPGDKLYTPDGKIQNLILKSSRRKPIWYELDYGTHHKPWFGQHHLHSVMFALEFNYSGTTRIKERYELVLDSETLNQTLQQKTITLGSNKESEFSCYIRIGRPLQDLKKPKQDYATLYNEGVRVAHTYIKTNNDGYIPKSEKLQPLAWRKGFISVLAAVLGKRPKGKFPLEHSRKSLSFKMFIRESLIFKEHYNNLVKLLETTGCLVLEVPTSQNAKYKRKNGKYLIVYCPYWNPFELCDDTKGAEWEKAFNNRSLKFTETWTDKTKQTKDYWVKIKSLKKLFYKNYKNQCLANGTVPRTPYGRCLMVDSPDHTYLMEGNIATHNTTLTEYLILYIATWGTFNEKWDVKYGVYVSDSIENGVKKMRKRLERRWKSSPFLQQAIPYTRFTDIRWEFANMAGLTTVFQGAGIMTGIRGTVEEGTRIRLVLADDVMSDADAKSPTVRQSIRDVIYSAINFGMHPRYHKVMWNGTPFNTEDPLYQAAGSGGWVTSIYPVCEKFPVKESEFRGIWEDRFDYNYVYNQYKLAKQVGNLPGFNKELLLRIASDEEKLIDEEAIPHLRHIEVMKNKQLFNCYITTDFATSSKETADDSVILVWFYTANKDWIAVDGIAKKQRMTQTLDKLFEFVRQYEPLGVGVEITGQQGGFIDWLKERMVTSKTFFTLAKEVGTNHEGIRPVKDKLSRLKQFVPIINSGKFHLTDKFAKSPAGIKLLYELSLVSDDGIKGTDNCIDATTMLQYMEKQAPNLTGSSIDTVEQEMYEDSGEIDDSDFYSVHLDDDGMPVDSHDLFNTDSYHV